MKPACLEDSNLALEDLMTQWPETVAVFLRHDMLCVGCLVNPFHSVTDACVEYGLNTEAFYEELRQAIRPKRSTTTQADADHKP